MGNSELIRANKIRIKLTKVQILLKQAKGLAENERDMVLDRIHLVLDQTLQYQDNLIKSLLEQKEIEKSRQLSIRAPKLKNKKEPKYAPQNHLKDAPSRNIFAENPFDKRDDKNQLKKETNLQNQDIFSENPFQKILHQAQDLLDQSIETQSDEFQGENQEESNQKRFSLLDQLYQAKALLELTEMESEVNITKKEFICIVHKGPIEGGAYICPHCRALYCFKCANTLKQQGDTCWACQYDYKLDLIY